MILDKVRDAAKAKGMTLKDVAEAAGIKYDTLMSWNEHVPGALSLWKVSKVLEIAFADLLEEAS